MASMRSLAGIDSSHLTEELTEALEKLRRQGHDIEERPKVRNEFPGIVHRIRRKTAAAAVLKRSFAE
jgi:hypothetical protein